MERMGLSMTKPDPIMIAVANFNNWYKKEKVRIAKSKRKKLKNITPKKFDPVTEVEQEFGQNVDVANLKHNHNKENI